MPSGDMREMLEVAFEVVEAAGSTEKKNELSVKLLLLTRRLFSPSHWTSETAPGLAE
jgi:hypothetical protein